MSTLSGEEKILLARIITARKLTAWLLLICSLFLGGVNGAALALGEKMPPSIYIIVVLCSACVIWGVVLFLEQRRNTAWLRSAASLVEIVGTPKKIGRAVGIPTGSGATLYKQLKQGVIHIDGKSYGTIPGLFAEIEDGVSATFDIAPLKFGGISGVIVHYKK